MMRSAEAECRLGLKLSKSAQSWHNSVLFRCSVPEDPDRMATLAQKAEAERRMRELLDENDLPQPDHVEYGFTCIRLFFNSSKHVVVIDLDEPEDAEAGVEGDVV
jgi:hypothetical protein